MNQNELYDIYSLWHIPFWQTSWFSLLVALCVCSSIGFCIWRLVLYIQHKSNNKTIWEQALHELNELKYAAAGDVGKEFYVQLLGIIKKYLHDRYGYDIASKTDQELLAVLGLVNFPPDLLEILRGVVDGSVIIRFANGQAAHDQMHRDLAASIIIIKKTIPHDQKC